MRLKQNWRHSDQSHPSDRRESAGTSESTSRAEEHMTRREKTKSVGPHHFKSLLDRTSPRIFEFRIPKKRFMNTLCALSQNWLFGLRIGAKWSARLMIILDQNSNGTVLTRYYCTIAADARTMLQIVVKPTTNECVTDDPANEIVPLILYNQKPFQQLTVRW